MAIESVKHIIKGEELDILGTEHHLRFKKTKKEKILLRKITFLIIFQFEK